jgi:sulfatase maturation enzyme AslB (radical SAM superfamily)
MQFLVSSVDQTLEQAAEAHRSGKLQDAERLYRAVLEAQPKHPDANHNIGVLVDRHGTPELALPFLKTAVECKPQQGEYWISYIEALANASQLGLARRVLQQGRQMGLGGTAIDRLMTRLDVDGSRPVEPLTSDQARYQAMVFSLRNSPFLEYPAHVHLETFAQCNAACNFCPYPTLERKGERMSDALIEKIISDLEDIPRSHKFQISPFKVNEPFLDTRLFDVLDQFKVRLPNAKVTLTSNASPITERTLERLSRYPDLSYLWISFNDHRKEAYETVMGLPYDRTIARLDLIHRKVEEGTFAARVVLSRVGDGSAVDREFAQWVKDNYPLFNHWIFPRGEWLGQVDSITSVPPPNVGCLRWFDLSITATGIVAHCCMDGKAEYPIGDASKSHLLEIYNHPEFRRLRESAISRLDVDPCRRCNFL